MSNKREIFILLGVCHGETEEVFLEEINMKYKSLFLKEAGLFKYEEYIEEPKLMFFMNKEKVQTTEFKKKLKLKLEDDSFINNIVDDPKELVDYKIHFIVILDFKEKDCDSKYEKELLETNAKKEILEVLDEINITGVKGFDNKKLFKDSTLIYFNKSIESNFKYFNQTKENGVAIKTLKNKKPKRMRKWLRSQDWNSTKEIKDYFNEQVINPEDNNINKLFDLLDEILNNLINFLNK